MVGREGFEPSTKRLKVTCFNQEHQLVMLKIITEPASLNAYFPDMRKVILRSQKQRIRTNQTLLALRSTNLRTHGRHAFR